MALEKRFVSRCNRDRDVALLNHLTSALTLFEILKFNEPIRIADYRRFSLCKGSRARRDIEEGNETERDVLFVTGLLSQPG